MAVSISGRVANSSVFKQFAGNLYMKGKSSKVGILSVLFSLVEKQKIHRMKRILNKCCLIIKDLPYGLFVKYLS